MWSAIATIVSSMITVGGMYLMARLDLRKSKENFDVARQQLLDAYAATDRERDLWKQERESVFERVKADLAQAMGMTQ